MSNKNGRKWISDRRRLAIYLRDGLACLWCGAGIEHGARLTLDHIRTRARNGADDSRNLFTACFICNSTRRELSVADFAARKFEARQSALAVIIAIRRARRRKMDRFLNLASELILNRGLTLAIAFASQPPTSLPCNPSTKPKLPRCTPTRQTPASLPAQEVEKPPSSLPASST